MSKIIAGRMLVNDDELHFRDDDAQKKLEGLIVQGKGNSETATMSQAAATVEFDKLSEEISDEAKNRQNAVAQERNRAVARENEIEKLFSNGSGFYGWGSIKYFMYEYEYSLAEQYGIEKIKWELFTKSEKDKVSIEHILPQTPTKHYWRNQFRQFSEAEIEQLSGALGNLLPLSQSVNSSLQNDSFYDKKSSNSSGRRGYENGSHSEILIAKEKDVAKSYTSSLL